MSESFDEQLARVNLMANGFGDWDLSPNDMAALRAVVARVQTLLASPESLPNGWRFDGAVPHGLVRDVTGRGKLCAVGFDQGNNVVFDFKDMAMASVPAKALVALLRAGKAIT